MVRVVFRVRARANGNVRVRAKLGQRRVVPRSCRA